MKTIQGYRIQPSWNEVADMTEQATNLGHTTVGIETYDEDGNETGPHEVDIEVCREWLAS